MMNCRTLLRRLGLLPAISHAEMSAAEDENIERTIIEHGKAVAQIQATAKNMTVANQRLRESINRSRSRSFADLETSMQKAGRRHVR